MAVCSFGKISLRGLIESDWPYGTDIYIRLFYAATEETAILIAASDSMDTFNRETDRFREKISLRTGIPADHIWYHELQAHAAPISPQLTGKTMDAIIEKAGNEALAMMQRAKKFTCRVAEADVGGKYSMNREQYVPGLGGVTVWAGLRFDEKGTPYCQDPARMVLRDYRPDLPAFQKPVYFDRPVDPKAYLFVFQDQEGGVIGTLSRFAAHPDVSVLFESRVKDGDYHFDFDWPGYLSEKLEAVFHAPSLYLNGPCGDLAMKKAFDHMDDYAASAGESKRIGEEMADVLVKRFREKHVALGDAQNLKCALFRIDLPMKEDFPRSLSEMENLQEEIETARADYERAKAENESPYEIKKKLDALYRLETFPSFIHRFSGFDEETLKKHEVTVPVTALRLGDYLFIGVPGESLSEMSLWLRSAFTGVKTVPIDQVNGYFGYMATPSSLHLGGYTYWCSWTSRESIPLLKEKILECMEDF